jgi:hypothetical protein
VRVTFGKLARHRTPAPLARALKRLDVVTVFAFLLVLVAIYTYASLATTGTSSAKPMQPTPDIVIVEMGTPASSPR